MSLIAWPFHLARKWLGNLWRHRSFLGLINANAPISSKRKPPKAELSVLELDTRSLINSGLVVAGTIIAADIVGQVASRIVTPTQVFLSNSTDWDVYGLDALPPEHKEGTPEDLSLAYTLTPRQEENDLSARVELARDDSDMRHGGDYIPDPPSHLQEMYPPPVQEIGKPAVMSPDALFSVAFLTELNLDADSSSSSTTTDSSTSNSASSSTSSGGDALLGGGGGGGSSATASGSGSGGATSTGGGGGGGSTDNSESPLPITFSPASSDPTVSAFFNSGGSMTPQSQASGAVSTDPQQPSSNSGPGLPMSMTDAGNQIGQPAVSGPTLNADLGKLPLAFEQNVGQTDSSVQYLARGQGYSAFLTSGEIALTLDKVRAGAAERGEDASSNYRDVVKVQFANANSNVTFSGGDELQGRSNYFLPGVDPVQASDVTQYGSVVAHNVWNGIDIRFQGSGQNLRFDIQAQAGADLSQVELHYAGPDSVSVDQQGCVVLHTPGGDVYQQAPTLYQTGDDGQQQPVSGAYVMRDDGNIGFSVGNYDSTKELVLDPTLSFATYLGGASNDYAYAVTTDLNNNLIIAGSTLSSAYPTTSDAINSSLSGTRDVFISKLNAAGDTLLFSTYIGGNETGDEQANAVTTDVGGNIFVTGTTSASNFYTTSGAYSRTMAGSQDAFVLELSGAGNNVVWSSFLGGSGVDKGRAIAVDGAGQVYVAGYAEANFPTVHAYQTSYGGSGDAFVTVFKADGSGLLGSTYLGGSALDDAYGIALDNSNHIYVDGLTSSSAYPTTGGAYQTSSGGGQDGFVSRLTLPSTTMTLDWSSYIGGSGEDGLRGIAVDSSNRAYVAGYSKSSNYPTTVGAYQTTLSGTQDAVVSRLDSNGTALGFSSYVGGTGVDEAKGIALDASNNVYLAGLTSGSFPTSNAAQSTYGGGSNDAFVLEMASSGASLTWSTYLGGSGDDYAQGISVDTNSNVIVAGATASTNFPTASPYQGSNAGGYDAFIARYDTLQPPKLTSISSDTGSSSSDYITTATTLTLSGTAPASATVKVYRADSGYLGSTTASANGTFTYDYSGTTLSEGTYAFTFTTTQSGVEGVQSNPYQVIVDKTAPTVTLTAPASTYDLTPELRVVATDSVGMPTSGTVTLDVDTNNDGNFTDAGETGYATATMNNGLAIFELTPALSISTVKIRARVNDTAGNEGTSSTATVVVGSSGSSFTTTDVTQQVDPVLGNALIQRGDVQVAHALDWDQSPGTSVGLDPALVYNSDRVNNKPIIQAQVQTDNGQNLPATITAQLSWNGGAAQAAQAFSTTGRTKGELLTIAQQVNTAATTSGLYTYSMTVTLDYGSPITKNISGSMYVIAEDSSALGAGWTFAGVDRLISVSGGLLREFGSGGYGFYSLSGGVYTSPAWDNGTLSAATAGGVTTYTYSVPEGSSWTFNGSGYQVQESSADGFALVTYSYNGSNNLSKVQTPDGGVTTINYNVGGPNNGLLQNIQTGSRTVTATLSSGNLTVIQNPDGGLHSLTYDSNHKLTNDNFGTLSSTYAYTSGAVSSFTNGDGGATSVSPQSTIGLAALAAVLRPSTTDPLNRTVDYQLDTSGRVTQQISGEGGVQAWTRDANGRVTTYSDALGNLTTYTLDSSGYPTTVTLADGTTTNSVYQSSFHARTQYTDESGNIYTYSYDSGGHQTSIKDALGKLTTMTYNASSGLLETTKDPLGNVTTTIWDSSRRLQRTVDPLGNISTVTYDSNGNVATEKDALGRVTTFMNDAMGRVTETMDALNNITKNYYEGAGLLTMTVDPLNNQTQDKYNSRGLVTKMIEAAGTTAQRSTLSIFDAAGQETSSRDAVANWMKKVYDITGRLQSTSDPLGNSTLSKYDLAGQSTGSRDPLGQGNTDTYNKRGQVTSSKDALGNVSTTTYDNAGNVMTVVDALGHTTSYSYDKDNRLIATTQAAGTANASTTTTVYDDAGNVAQTIDALGHTTSYSYDKDNRKTTVTEAVGTSVQRSMTYVYDAAGNLTDQTDWRGFRTTIAYDNLNRKTSMTEAVGQTEQRATIWNYDANGNVSSINRTGNEITSYAYDNLNRQISSTENGGSSQLTTTTILDGNGNAYSTVDPLGKATRSSTDVVGRGGISIDALGNKTRSFYSGASTVSSSKDALGNVTSFQTDKLGRTTKTTDPLSNAVSTDYDAAGNVKDSVDALGNRTTYGYDELNRRTSVTDALNHVVTTAYDAAGNVTKTIDALGKTTTYTFDELNRQVSVQDPGGGIFTTVYDAVGDATTTIDALGHRTTNTFDGLGRKTKTLDAINGTTTYIYDSFDNMTTLVDPVGNRTTFTFDTLNRKTQETDPTNHSITYAYDNDNRLSSQTDRLGQRRDFTYDDAGRKTGEVWKDSGGTTVNTLTFTYDNNGNQTVAQDSHGAYTLTYDADNRVSTVKDMWGVLLTMTWDANGNRTKLEDSLGGTQTSTYDAVNRLTSRTELASGATMVYNQTFTVRNQVATATRYTGATGTTKIGETDYTYDDAGRVTNILQKDGGTTTLSNLTYSYDLASRETTQVLNGTTTTYSYDNTNQLTGDGTNSPTYDANGNRTNTGYTTGTGNQMTNDGTFTLTYDNAGAVTKKSKGGSAETWTYTYDNRQQMTGVSKRATDGGTLQMIATYVYDVWGNRIESDVWQTGSGTTTVHYALDGWKKPIDGSNHPYPLVGNENFDVLAELDGNNNLTLRRVYGDGIAQPLARISSGGTVYGYLEDKQNSVFNLLSNTGTLAATMAYDGFGKQTTSPVVTEPLGSQGMRLDNESGLYLFGESYYDPLTCRWYRPDPEGFKSGPNLYRPMGNDPPNATDPSGDKVVLSVRPTVRGPKKIGPRGGHTVIWWIGKGTFASFEGGGGFTSGTGNIPTPKVSGVSGPMGRNDIQKLGIGDNPTDDKLDEVLPKIQLKGDYKDHKLPEDQIWDVVTGPYKTENEELRALLKAFARLKQLPYSMHGPNSNTYVKQLLQLAGFSVAQRWEYVTYSVYWHAATPYDYGNLSSWDPAKSEESRRETQTPFGLLSESIQVGPRGTVGWADGSYGGSKYDDWGKDKYEDIRRVHEQARDERSRMELRKTAREDEERYGGKQPERK
jgi:RHS repeat-associated protein